MTRFQDKSFTVAQSRDKAKYWPPEWEKPATEDGPTSQTFEQVTEELERSSTSTVVE